MGKSSSVSQCSIHDLPKTILLYTKQILCRISCNGGSGWSVLYHTWHNTILTIHTYIHTASLCTAAIDPLSLSYCVSLALFYLVSSTLILPSFLSFSFYHTRLEREEKNPIPLSSLLLFLFFFFFFPLIFLFLFSLPPPLPSPPIPFRRDLRLVYRQFGDSGRLAIIDLFFCPLHQSCCRTVFS